MSRILWGVHTCLFLFCVMRFRIPVFIIPWLLLYLIHSHRVWLKRSQTEADRRRSDLKSRLVALELSAVEQNKILDLATELWNRSRLFETKDISGALSKVKGQLLTETDAPMIEVLTDKARMLQDLSDEAEAINRSAILLEERIGLLELQVLQDSDASVEYQDIEAILNERQAIHDIMQRLDSWE